MVGLLLANAYPDRVAQRRGANGNRYLLANGRGAKLLDSCRGAELMVAVSLDGRGDESRIFLAASIAVADLEQSFPAQIAWQAETYWSRSEGVVVSREARRYGALLLGERPLKVDDEAAVVAAMLDGVRAEGLEALPWSDAARQLRTRLRSLRQWLPDEAWPDLSDSHLLETVEVWLAPYLNNISRRSHLARLDMVAIIKSMLDWSQQQQLEELAPTHLQVPSGSRKRLEYQVDGSAPVLAVKLQELFGLAETPAVARGRVEVMLHLLSPAQRPIQVTQDLKSFWANTYAEVKRELKGRYPKHPGPTTRGTLHRRRGPNHGVEVSSVRTKADQTGSTVRVSLYGRFS
ncbi:hypothetical protein HUE57_18700 [Candidatus Reidiella endopervernicosa]|uniref:ATP-dependent RNA helicase HrpB C-terminal domain-containing protein n=2 Tax=Candidatus Reidiella endopervernicosa TaxID=2738883 RepID=A0A6N0I0G9_9GAMM|nr:hypothetical protein HUE57_18700 [Candidatus Reidiella endopervernicosa]